ncbi:hypothetical protein SISSUDRAFT_1131998 [Sistotremastrum suecicum HHB10207 ss-3]|uniref:Uncharacterized protein n=1 Tax=Sistotremastrum suecicum HHB10207 ss-3 TaxID=1314776 RepID=A0A165ZF18_9AGAM|nr:hypothetical protein SISSUDRAFT_1131998 [Sistotremastrum suecicum HHB10207 ss-3]
MSAAHARRTAIAERQRQRANNALPYARPSKFISSFWNFLAGNEDGIDEQNNLPDQPDEDSRPSMSGTRGTAANHDGTAGREPIAGSSTAVESRESGQTQQHSPPLESSANATRRTNRTQALTPNVSQSTTQSRNGLNRSSVPRRLHTVVSTRDWIQEKVNRGEGMTYGELVGLLGMLDDIRNTEQPPAAAPTGNFTFSFGPTLSSVARAQEVPRPSLSTNPNGQLLFSGAGSATVVQNPSRVSGVRTNGYTPEQEANTRHPPAARSNVPSTTNASTTRRRSDGTSTSRSQGQSTTTRPGPITPTQKTNIFGQTVNATSLVSPSRDRPSSQQTTTDSNATGATSDLPSSNGPLTAPTGFGRSAQATSEPTAGHSNSIFNRSRGNATSAAASSSQSSNTPATSRPSSSTPLAHSIVTEIVDTVTKEEEARKKAPRFDVSNPYQKTNHVRAAPRKVPAPRAVARPPPPAPTPVAAPPREPSFLDYIQASAPNVPGRSRTAESSNDTSTAQDSASSSGKRRRTDEPTVEEIAEEPSRKKTSSSGPSVEGLSPEQAATAAAELPRSRSYVVSEPEEGSSRPRSAQTLAPSTSYVPAPPASKGKSSFSFPKEPSPLRQSFAPPAEEETRSDPEPEPESAPAPAPAMAPAPESLPEDPIQIDESPNPIPPSSAPTSAQPAVEQVLELPRERLPRYSFDFNPASSSRRTPIDPKARKQALDLPSSALPKYTFNFGTDSLPASARLQPQPIPMAAPPINFAPSTGERYVFGSSSNPPNAASSSNSVAGPLTPGSSTSSSAPVVPFNWSAAGLSQPTLDGDSWICSWSEPPKTSF